MSGSDPILPLKRQVGAVIAAELRSSQSFDAAAALNIDASRIAELRREQLARFSLESLIRYSDRLGRRVSIQIGGSDTLWRHTASRSSCEAG